MLFTVTYFKNTCIMTTCFLVTCFMDTRLLQKIPMKDFAAEIRASVDVENFLHQAQLLLDIQENNMEDIIDVMLHHLLDNEEPQVSVEEAKKAVFTHDSSI